MAAEDRRVLKTKKLIDDTCWALMQKKPFEEITVQDIAKQAAINRATFYRYHADKFDWLEKKIRQMVRDLAEKSGGLMTSAASKDATAAFEAIFDHLDAHYAQYALLLRHKSTIIAQDLLGELHVQLSSRMVDEALSPLEEMRFHYSMSAVVGAIEWWLRNDRPLSSKAMARELSHLHSDWRGDIQA